MGMVVGGSLLTEMVFNYPGLGSLLNQAIVNVDYPLMQGLFLIISLTVLAAAGDRGRSRHLPRPETPVHTGTSACGTR
jgi:hypothetical protein